MLGLKNTLWNTVTGMNTSKAALSTVGHNIANANTEGYSRQKVTIGARAPVKVFTGSEQISQAGQGARLTNIERAHSSFLERQLLRDRLNRGFFDGQRQALEVYERLFEEGVSNTIGQSIDTFFNFVRELSQDPSSTGHRQMVLGQAEQLARDFNNMATETREVQTDIDRSLVAHVDRINSLAAVIADSNARVGAIEAVGRTANDNRDQRDNAIRELATLIDVRVMYSDTGEAKVELANGFSLVQGTVTAELSTLPDPQNNGLLAIQHTSISGVTTDITAGIRSGELGGQLEARDRVLPAHMAEIDSLAFTFINEVNTIHRAGFGLDGIDGRDLFSPIGGIQGAALAMQVDPNIAADNSRIAASIDPVGLPGDNQNLLRLADLQQTHHALLGGVSFNHFYAETIRSVGQSVRSVDQLATIYDTRFEQSEALRESIEGVSIDDEMVDLSRFQKHFEASARVMDTVNRLMESVLQLVQ